MRGRKTTGLIFSLGKSKKDNRPRRQEMSWPDFVQMCEDNISAGLGISFKNCSSENEYLELKSKQEFIAAAYTDNRRNVNNVDCRSLLFIDLDSVPASVVKETQERLDSGNIQYLGYSTPGDYSEFKDPDLRAVRFIIPLAKPLAADRIFETQCRFTHWLGLWGVADETAHQRSRIMYLPHREAEILGDPFSGVPFRTSRLATSEWEPPEESGTSEWSPATLELAEGNSAGVSEWAFENGLELMPSGRGWAVCCPNHLNHTNNDGTDGSTAILLPDALNPEVRFQCQHSHCQELNRHQHLAFRMLGVPETYCPQAHGVSRTQMRSIFGDTIHEDDAEEIRQAVGRAADRDPEDSICTAEDLEDAPNRHLSNKIPMVEGLLNFASTWSLIGESNIGKSFYQLGKMACVAAGIPFAGQKTIRAHCFYFDAEGGESTQVRKEALQIKYGDDLDWLHIIDLSVTQWDITSSAGQRRIIKHIRSVAGLDPVGILAFDSLNQTVAFRDATLKPFDENNAADMGELAKALKRIAAETGGSPGVIHHPAKDSKGRRSARGSSALQGAIDYNYFLDQPDPEKHGQLNFYHEKSRNGVKQSCRGFLLKSIKVPGHVKDTSVIDRLQSDKEAPDFESDLAGLTPKPFSTPVRDETLVLIPVALEPFAEPGSKVDSRSPAKSREQALTRAQAKVMEAIELLTEELPDDEGFSKNKVCVKAGKGSGTLQAFGELVTMGLIVPATSDNSSWKLPVSVSDTGDRAAGDNTASAEDLE